MLLYKKFKLYVPWMSYATDLTKGMNEIKRNDLPKESRVI